MNKTQKLSFDVFALGLSSLLVMLMCETISRMLNLDGLCTLPIATTNVIGGTIFIVTIVAFSVLLISVSLEIDEKRERIKMEEPKEGYELRRAPGTCCPEPSCDYVGFDHIKCAMCNKRCGGCIHNKKTTERQFCIRRFVLLITGEMWHILDKSYPGEIFFTTAKGFLDIIGLPSGKSAYYNLEERAFFDAIYDLWRERDKNENNKNRNF